MGDILFTLHCNFHTLDRTSAFASARMACGGSPATAASAWRLARLEGVMLTECPRVEFYNIPIIGEGVKGDNRVGTGAGESKRTRNSADKRHRDGGGQMRKMVWNKPGPTQGKRDFE